MAQPFARAFERPQSEYEFLVGRLIDASTLARATEIATRIDVHPHDVLIANGWIKADDYYEALAESCGLPFARELRAYDMRSPARDATPMFGQWSVAASRRAAAVLARSASAEPAAQAIRSGGQYRLLSALIHPWFYGLLAFDLVRGTFLARPESMLAVPVQVLGAGNLIVGYAAAMCVGYLTVLSRHLAVRHRSADFLV